MVVFLLVKTTVALHRCNHNHSPLCIVTKVIGKKKCLKIYFNIYIPICGICVSHICMWKHLISDFWCVINAVTIFAGFSEVSVVHMHHIPLVQWGSFRKLQDSKSSTVQLQHRHAMFLSANKRHWMWGNACVCHLLWAVPWLENPVFH